jgi:hypothetical protein
MKQRRGHIVIILICTVLLCQCENTRQSTDQFSPKQSLRSVTVPSFNSDSAYAYIKKQVAFGPRVPNTSAHKACGQYLVEEFRRLNAEVVVQDFVEQAYNGNRLYLKNIVATYNPEAKKRILLAAHWDTRPYADKDLEDRYKPIDGANDGASGVGVLLEVARAMNRSDLPKVGIDIVLFDGEDYGEHEDVDTSPTKDGRMQIWWCLGSQYWSKNPHVPRYSAYYGILLDMVGGREAEFYKEGGSMQFAPKIVDKVWKIARSLGHSKYFVEINSPGIMDDHIFVNRDAKIPMIDIVPYDPEATYYYFPDFHHTHDDNMSIIDKQTLQAVGETLLYTLYME